jgi:hypothetical protein
MSKYIAMNDEPNSKVYPVLKIDSLKTRLKFDLNKFQEVYNSDDIKKYIKEKEIAYNNQDFYNDKMISDINDKIDAPIAKIQTDMKLNNTYVEDINGCEDKAKLWVLRTFLFYYLMMKVCLMCQNKKIFDYAYDNTQQIKKIPIFRDLSFEIQNIRLGIFGSMTPTSDIDVGVQYIGTDRKTPFLAYVLQLIEDAFIIYTGKSTLDYDIEPYADLYLYCSPKNGLNYFYLSTKTELDHIQYKKLLSLACASIARSYFHSDFETKKDIKYYKKHIPETLNKYVNDLQTHINDLIENDKNLKQLFNTSDIKIRIQNELKTLNSPFQIGIQKELETLHSPFQEGIQNAYDYMNISYEAKRTMYYTKVEIAQKKVLAIFKILDDIEVNELTNSCALKQTVVVDTILLIGDTLLYREESYTCTATITHVVRTIQDKPIASNKYATECVSENPYAVLGQKGYMLSILEQLGNLIRFYKKYCVKNSNDEKCSKKREKYMLRLLDANQNIDDLDARNTNQNQTLGAHSGGKRKRKTKKRRRTKRKRTYRRRVL